MITEYITKKLSLKEYDLILVYDFDDILSDEKLVNIIDKSGYIIIEYDDPDIFRNFYETNIRSYLDSGEELDSKLLIKVKKGVSIPYDIKQRCYIVKLSLSNIFYKFNYHVIKTMYNDKIADLYKIHEAYEGEALGVVETKDYILKREYGVVLELINDFNALIKNYLSLLYNEKEIPDILLEYLIDELKNKANFKNYPIEKVVCNRKDFLSFMQHEWEKYILSFSENKVNLIIDFSNYDIRAYIDNMFKDNYLTPVKYEEIDKLPEWVQEGVVYNEEEKIKKKFDNLICRIKSLISRVESYKDWFIIADLWSEVILLCNDSEKNYSLDRDDYIEVNRLLNANFKVWMLENYNKLSSLSYTKTPIMVHQIPLNINFKMRQQKFDKVALIIIDGMSLDDWKIIRNNLYKVNKWVIEENLSFAWIPTLTSISRQAIFSGEVPIYFKDKIFTTNYEEKHWKNFWINKDQSQNSIAYVRNIKTFNENKLNEILENKKIKVLGCVVNTIDDIMHGQQFSTEGMHHDIKLWLKKGYLNNFLEKLINKGFNIFISSDHGNLGSVGQGNLKEGSLVEQAGERVRIYNKNINYSNVLDQLKTYEWSGFGLPEEYAYIMSEGNYAFNRAGETIVSHGGVSLEEVIVPFIQIRKED